jgi:hypothetical protein
MLEGKRGLDDGERGCEMTYPDNLDLETPEADAAEQATSARLEESDVDERALADETPEWDGREQSRIVELEDEYR